MKILLSFLLAASFAAASTVTVTVRGVTAQQAVLDIQASDNSACTVQISTDPGFGVIANDVNENYHPGASSCTRAGSVVSGNHYVFVAGYRGVYDGSLNWRYSRSLQASTAYYYKVTLASGATASGSFTTIDPPLGNSAPDPVLPDPAHPNLPAFPTVDWNTTGSTIIDPQTGMAMFAFTRPGDMVQTQASKSLVEAWDLGSSWTLWSGGNTASCTGSGCATDSILLWGQTNWSGESGFRLDTNSATITDLNLSLTGFGSAAQGTDTAVKACLSIDFGTSCATNTLTLTLPSGTAGTVTSDSKYPDAYFAAWGGAGTKMRDDVQPALGTFSGLSGHVLTSNGGGISPGGSPGGEFPVSLLTDNANMPIFVGGTDPICPNNLCHVASLSSSTVANLVENVTSLSYPTLTAAVSSGATSITLSKPLFVNQWGELGNLTIGSDTVYCHNYSNGSLTASSCSGIGSAHSAGATVTYNAWIVPSLTLKLWKATGTGTITIAGASWKGTYEQGNGTGDEGNNGNTINCGSTNATVSVAADGSTPITPNLAFQCTVTCTGCGPSLYAVIPGTNESRVIENLNGDKSGIGLSDPLHYSSRTSTGTCRWTYQGNWKSLNNGSGDMFSAESCTAVDNFGNPQTSYTTEITSAYPEIDPNVFGPMVVSSDWNGRYILYDTQIQQNQPYYWCAIDTSLPSGNGQVVYCDNSLKSWPGRWDGNHGMNSHIQLSGNGDQASIDNSPAYLGYTQNEWDVNISTIYNNGGSTALTNTFVDPQTCEQLGVTDARWMADGAHGAYCIKVNIPYEPMQTKYLSGGSPVAMDSSQIWVQWRNSAASGSQVSQLAISPNGASLSISGGGATASYTNHTYAYNSNATATVSGGTGWVFVSLDSTGNINLNSNLAISCLGCTAVQENNPYWPMGSVPLYDWHVTSGQFDQAGHDFRRFPLGSDVIGSRSYPWAHNSSACNGDGSTSNCWSYLEPIQEGDAFYDPAVKYTTASNEAFLVAKKTELSNGTIDLVLARNAYDAVAGSGSAAGMYPHTAGWGAFMAQTLGQTFHIPLDSAPTVSNVSEDYPITNSHGDGWTNAVTNTNYSIHAGGIGIYPALDLGGYAGAYSARTGTVPQVYSQPETIPLSESHPFNWVQLGVNINSQQLQSHAAADTTHAPAREANWALDGVPYGGATGGTTALWSNPLTLASGKSHTYLIGPNTSGDYYGEGQSKGGVITAQTIKTRPVFLTAGHYIFADKSGANSASTWGASSDSQAWTYCIAMTAGECVSGSAVGNTYISAPNVDTTGNCSIATTELRPCFTMAPPSLQVASQFDISKSDIFGLRWRKLTTANTLPATTNNYWNAHSVPDGSLAIVACVWCNNGQISEALAVKLPPFPNPDSLARNAFIPVKVQVSGVSGSTVRARFGYAEYGADSNGQYLYCGTRNEDCTTAVANSDPYAWAHETQTWTACTTACTITIPAISGRVLYYVVDRQLSSGQVISSPQRVTTVQ